MKMKRQNFGSDEICEGNFEYLLTVGGFTLGVNREQMSKNQEWPVKPLAKI